MQEEIEDLMIKAKNFDQEEWEEVAQMMTEE